MHTASEEKIKVLLDNGENRKNCNFDDFDNIPSIFAQKNLQYVWSMVIIIPFETSWFLYLYFLFIDFFKNFYVFCFLKIWTKMKRGQVHCYLILDGSEKKVI